MTVNASGEGRISGGSRGCQKLSRPINAGHHSLCHSLLGFLEGQVGVPGLATKPEAASAQLSIRRLWLPVRSRLGGGRVDGSTPVSEWVGSAGRRGDQETSRQPALEGTKG